MSYNAAHGLKKQSLFRSILVVAGFASICVQSNVATAADDWWFDVEVIVFKRNVSLGDIGEKFPLAAPSPNSAQNEDLLTAYLKPNLSYLIQTLPICNEPTNKPYVWGPVAVLADEATDDNVSDNAELQATPQESNDTSIIQTVHSVDIDTTEIQTVPSVDIAATTIQSTPSEDIDNDSDQTTSEIGVENTYTQNSYDNTLATAAEAALNSAVFTANILDSLGNWQPQAQLSCVNPKQLELLKNPFETPLTEKIVPRVPVSIDGVDWIDVDKPYLLPQSSLTLSTLFTDIGRQRDLLPLLHVGWRQEVVFGEDKAPSFRLFAGKNFADKFSVNGELLGDIKDPVEDNYLPEDEVEINPADSGIPILDEENLFSRINKALADDSPITINEQSENISSDSNAQQAISALWELDGKLKVYLQYVGRTPYLHIDTNLEYRSPIFIKSKQAQLENTIESNAIVVGQTDQPNYLQSVQFNQLRRVISKQVHYFDHPLFGMIVHITRYKRPEPELDDPELQENQMDLDAPRVEH
jgi:hypothetical protein